MRPQNQQNQATRPPNRAEPAEGIEMENIQHQDLGLGGVIGTPSPPSRQAWSRDNPGFEPEDEIMQADWPPASPGRRSLSTASSSSSCGLGSIAGRASSPRIPRGAMYPTPTVDGRRQDRLERPSCMKQILHRIRGESLCLFSFGCSVVGQQV